jgi:hypothetical protein
MGITTNAVERHNRGGEVGRQLAVDLGSTEYHTSLAQSPVDYLPKR